MLGCGLSDEGCGLYPCVVVTAGGERSGGCTYMNERELYPTPVSTHLGFEKG